MSIKGFTNLSDKGYPELMKDSILDFFDWGFLEIGNVINVTVPTSGVYGGSFHQLKTANDPRYTNGQVWQSAHKNWVWESGALLPVQPIAISGVYLNGSLTTTGFTIDYPNGRIIFDTAISTNTTVTLNYSYKYVTFFSSDFDGLIRQIRSNGNRPDHAQFQIAGSGQWDVPGEGRVDTPFACLELIDTNSNEGYQLGGAYYSKARFIFHVVGTDPTFVDRIGDIISDQANKTFFGVDYNKVLESGVYPLNYDGSLSSSPLTFKEMVEDGYRWRKIYFVNGTKEKKNEILPGLYHTPVRFTTQVVKGYF